MTYVSIIIIIIKLRVFTLSRGVGGGGGGNYSPPASYASDNSDPVFA